MNRKIYIKNYMKNWIKKHPNYYKKYKHNYYLKNKDRIDNQNKLWQTNNREQSNLIKRRFRISKKGKLLSVKESIRYKKQIHARLLVNNLLRNHNIKENCAICGDEKVECHHENYDEAFIIIWLCKEHHLKGDVE